MCSLLMSLSNFSYVLTSEKGDKWRFAIAKLKPPLQEKWVLLADEKRYITIV